VVRLCERATNILQQNGLGRRQLPVLMTLQTMHALSLTLLGEPGSAEAVARK